VQPDVSEHAWAQSQNVAAYVQSQYDKPGLVIRKLSPV
jgi:hypothetical protein